MNNIDFELRLNAATRYHNFLSMHLESDWISVFRNIENGKDVGLPEIMVLLHPRWHYELEFTANSDPRGLNNFSPAGSNAKCRAVEVWGYECPYLSSPIHIDHTFPFARGGATKSDNAMYLCAEHNLSKSTDLHIIPWERLVGLSWIEIQLKLFLRMAQRHSADPLYFPERKTKRI